VQVRAARVQEPERVRALARALVVLEPVRALARVPEQAALQRVLARVQQARRVPQVLPQPPVLQPPSFRL
jgi:hypothetical protein